VARADPIHGHCFELGKRFCAEGNGKRHAGLLGIGQCPAARADATALPDGAMEQPFCQRRYHQLAYRHSTGRLAENGDAVRIAAKRGYVPPHPFERGDLIHQAVVAGSQPWISKKSECSDTIVERDDDRAFVCQIVAPVIFFSSGAVIEAAPENPDHNRPLFRSGMCGGPDVEIEAILGNRLWTGIEKIDGLRIVGLLWTDGGEVIAVANAGPMGGALRRAPSQFADWWRRERDSLVDTNAGLETCRAGYHSGIELDVLGGEQCRARDCEDQKTHVRWIESNRPRPDRRPCSDGAFARPTA